VSKESLKAYGIQFDAEDQDKIISDSKVVAETIMKIWHDKYTEGAGKDIVTMGGLITQIKNLWGIFLQDVGKAGVYDLVISKLQGIVTWVQNNSEQIKKWATDISKFFSDTFAGLSAVLEKVLGVNLNPEVMPNKGKSVEEIGKMLGMDETQIKNAAIMMANGFTDAFLKTPAAQDIGKDVLAILDKSSEVKGGKTALSPFWEKVVSGIEDGTFKTRLSTAFTSLITTLMTDEALKTKAKEFGTTIGQAIIDGIGAAISTGAQEVTDTLNNASWWDILTALDANKRVDTSLAYDHTGAKGRT
jgi:hypothetical protein